MHLAHTLTQLRLMSLLMAALACAGCQSVLPHRHQPPGALDGALDGLYEVTYELPELGGTYTGLIAARTNEDTFRANSRPGVVADAVGGVRGLLATWFGGPAMRGGAFMHWSGTINPKSNAIDGEMVTPFGRMRTNGYLPSGTVDVFVQGRQQPAGSLHLAPAVPEAHPKSDLMLLTNEIRDVLDAHLFDPTLRETRAMRRFLTRLDRAASWACDDLEYAFAFFVAARGLPFSHFGLQRMADTAPTPMDAKAYQPTVSMIADAAAVAVLRIPSFAIDPELINAAFAEVAAMEPDALVIDLRNNTGGSFASIRVAAFLLDEEKIVGSLFRAGAREDVLAGRWDQYPIVYDIDSIDALNRMLDEYGAIVGAVRPAERFRFAGPVCVLSSSYTASACEPLVELLKRAGRATTVGEPTAGSMLSSERFELPHRWQLVLPTADYVTADLIRIEGRGVGPDIGVLASAALHEAVRILREWNNQSVAESDAVSHRSGSADVVNDDASLEHDMMKKISYTRVVLIDELWNFSDPAASEARFEKAASEQCDGPWRLILETQRARAQGLQRRFEDARATLDEVERNLNEHADDDRLAVVRPWLWVERGRVHNSSGDRDAARPLFQQAWDMLTNSEQRDDALAVDAAHMIAMVTAGDESVRWNERALDMAESSDDPRARRWRASLLNNLGWTYHEAGRFEHALEYFERALAARRERSQPRETLIARWAVARCLRSLGRVKEALTHQRELLDAWNELGEQDGYVYEELGECLLLLDRHEEARQHFAAAHNVLSQDMWLRANEPQRLERLAGLAGVIHPSDEPDRD